MHLAKFCLVGWLIKLLKLTISIAHRVEVGPQPAHPPPQGRPCFQGEQAYVDDHQEEEEAEESTATSKKQRMSCEDNNNDIDSSSSSIDDSSSEEVSYEEEHTGRARSNDGDTTDSENDFIKNDGGDTFDDGSNENNESDDQFSDEAFD
jgi:hypothetical protein